MNFLVFFNFLIFSTDSIETQRWSGFPDEILDEPVDEPVSNKIFSIFFII